MRSSSSTKLVNQIRWEGRTGEVSTTGKGEGSAAQGTEKLSRKCPCLGGENSK